MEGERFLSRPLHDMYQNQQHSIYGIPTQLNLGLKVFLSHSGQDKDFTRVLHHCLFQQYHDTIAFFDESSLPKATPVNMETILMEAKGSELGVVVLTEDFFTRTRNPMLELEAFVVSEVKLLPLFLEMSVKQFKEKERRDGWEKQWRQWPGMDDEKIKKWRKALDVVSTFSGLECHKKDFYHPVDFDEVVKEVTLIVSPAISFAPEGVCGKERLCEFVNDLFKEAAWNRSSFADRMSTQCVSTSAISSPRDDNGNTLDVVGIHGFAGLGKTTLCKCLLDFYFRDFHGKVCHIDVGSHKDSLCSRMWHVLFWLTSYTTECNNNQSIDQVRNRLVERLSSMKDPVFLAIDNILPDRESQEEADFYLSCGFPKGSKIFITSMSECVLTNLLSQHSCRFSTVIKYMPNLTFKEAKDIFKHGFPDLRTRKFLNGGEELDDPHIHLDDLLELGTIYSGRYHPLMLRSLVSYVRQNRIFNNDYKQRLIKLMSEGVLDPPDAWEKLFKRLDTIYASLGKDAKCVFLDWALYFNATGSNDGREWIQRLYAHLIKHKMDGILLRLQDSCLIEGPCNNHRWRYSVGEREWSILDEGPCNNHRWRYSVGEREWSILDEGPCNNHRWRYSVGEREWSILDEGPCNNHRWRYSVGKREWSILDLLVEFCKYKILNDDNSLHYVVVEDDAHFCAVEFSRIARHVSISRWAKAVTELDLTDLAGELKVLHLVDNAGLQQVRLSRTSCAKLGSLIVSVPACTLFSCTFDNGKGGRGQSYMPNLLWVKLKGNICFEPASLQLLPTNVAFAESTILGQKVEVIDISEMCGVRSIDITTCTNLQKLTLKEMPELESVLGLHNSHLEKVSIQKCEKLFKLTFSAENCNMCSNENCTHNARNVFVELWGLPSLSVISGWVELKGNICFQLGSLQLLPFNVASPQSTIFGPKVKIIDMFKMCRVMSIDVTICTNLQRLTLKEMPGLESVVVLHNSHLQEVSIQNCEKLSKLTFSADNCKMCFKIDNCTYDVCNVSVRLWGLPSLRYISGLDKLTNLKKLFVYGCHKVQALAIPSHSLYTAAIEDCRSLERIALCPMSSPPAGAGSSNQCYLSIKSCPGLRRLQTHEHVCTTFQKESRYVRSVGGYTIDETYCTRDFLQPELFGKLLEDVGINSSLCKGRVRHPFEFFGTVAGVERLVVVDAQNIGLLISTFKACPRFLSINCTEGGDCGCDQNVPLFDPLAEYERENFHFPGDLPFSPIENPGSHNKWDIFCPSFEYHCPQVRDLASLAQWHMLRSLNLSGCTSVEVWPDFSVMISLRCLDLRNTSLKEWPAGVQALPRLCLLFLNGCQQLPLEELMKTATVELQNCTRAHYACIFGSLESLKKDLKAAIRESCAVVDFVDAFSQKLLARYDGPPSSFFKTEFCSFIGLCHILAAIKNQLHQQLPPALIGIHERYVDGLVKTKPDPCGPLVITYYLLQDELEKSGKVRRKWTACTKDMFEKAPNSVYKIKYHYYKKLTMEERGN